MNTDLIFYPVLIQVLLVVVLYIILAKRKKQASLAGEVDEARRSLHADAWPESVMQVNNCIRNQFEVPVLFYVAVMALWAIGGVSVLTLGLSWLFVFSRLAHAYVHVGSNYVPVRRKLFMFGVILVLMLVVTAFLALLG